MGDGPVNHGAGAHPKGNHINTGAPEHVKERAGWYILRVDGGAEFAARKVLSDLGWTGYVPVERKWRTTFLRRRQVIEAEYPRFPRYLFLYVEPPRWPTLNAWPCNRYIRGILGMDGRPVRIAEGELKRIIDESGAPVPHTGSVPVHKAFQVGDLIHVKAGMWRDWRVRIDALDSSGAQIKVPLFGRKITARVPLRWLEAAGP